ncbi:hypothetical protein [Streptomyces sp. NPDC004528]|uniref:hypothetical protein n=1 Tax=Streptomyces sp. NPDC004528 TaxID=3154550 RepID=UPI0033AE90DF
MRNAPKPVMRTVRFPFAGYIALNAPFPNKEMGPFAEANEKVAKEVRYQLNERWDPTDPFVCDAFSAWEVEEKTEVKVWPLPVQAPEYAGVMETLTAALAEYDRHTDWWSEERDKYRDEDGNIRPEMAKEYEKAVQQYDEVACDVMDTLAEKARALVRLVGMKPSE